MAGVKPAVVAPRPPPLGGKALPDYAETEKARMTIPRIVE